MTFDASTFKSGIVWPHERPILLEKKLQLGLKSLFEDNKRKEKSLFDAK
jgi:hypothetical protein